MKSEREQPYSVAYNDWRSLCCSIQITRGPSYRGNWTCCSLRIHKLWLLYRFRVSIFPVAGRENSNTTAEPAVLLFATRQEVFQRDKTGKRNSGSRPQPFRTQDRVTGKKIQGGGRAGVAQRSVLVGKGEASATGARARRENGMLSVSVASRGRASQVHVMGDGTWCQAGNRAGLGAE